jgi:hypothetical protein
MTGRGGDKSASIGIVALRNARGAVSHGKENTTARDIRLGGKRSMCHHSHRDDFVRGEGEGHALRARAAMRPASHALG